MSEHANYHSQVSDEDSPTIVYTRDFAVEDDPSFFLLVGGWQNALVMLWGDELVRPRIGSNQGSCFRIDPSKIIFHRFTISEIIK